MSEMTFVHRARFLKKMGDGEVLHFEESIGGVQFKEDSYIHTFSLDKKTVGYIVLPKSYFKAR